MRYPFSSSHISEMGICASKPREVEQTVRIDDGEQEEAEKLATIESGYQKNCTTMRQQSPAAPGPDDEETYEEEEGENELENTLDAISATGQGVAEETRPVSFVQSGQFAQTVYSKQQLVQDNAEQQIACDASDAEVIQNEEQTPQPCDATRPGEYEPQQELGSTVNAGTAIFLGIPQDERNSTQDFQALGDPEPQGQGGYVQATPGPLEEPNVGEENLFEPSKDPVAKETEAVAQRPHQAEAELDLDEAREDVRRRHRRRRAKGVLQRLDAEQPVAREEFDIHLDDKTRQSLKRERRGKMAHRQDTGQEDALNALLSGAPLINQAPAAGGEGRVLDDILGTDNFSL